LDFFHVIAECDETAYSFRALHDISKHVYHYTKIFIYRLLTVLFGLPLLIFWGLFFGVYTFAMIWLVAPMRRLSQSTIAESGIYIQAISNAIITPLARSYGNVFSQIRVNLANEGNNQGKQIQV
jgi:hypothetical protein